MTLSSESTCCERKEMVFLPSFTGSAGEADEKPASPPRLGQTFVEGAVSTPAGPAPRVSSRLLWRDRFGAFKARWGVGRMDYAIDPGLYALGNPDRESPVLVSANYKMSFDKLRSALPGRDLWILVLDTKGINVWCAAGKGTFGTEELVGRIASSGLKEAVGGRSLILPQLGAPGVAAHEVRKLSGFAVHYGPIDACDLPAYLDAGCKATGPMRVKSFTLGERAVLIPVELVDALKPALIMAPLLFLLGGVAGLSWSWANALREGLFSVLALASAVAGGAVVFPLLLPWLPGRAFSTKGLWLGAALALLLVSARGFDLSLWAGRLGVFAWMLIVPAVTAYLAMNFTGCSTYTSLSGVNKEMRWALPAEIAMGAAGLLLWVGSRLLA